MISTLSALISLNFSNTDFTPAVLATVLFVSVLIGSVTVIFEILLFAISVPRFAVLTSIFTVLRLVESKLVHTSV